MSDRTFNLPLQDDMLARLTKVNDEPDLKQKFYPLLLQHAGERKVAPGIVMMLQLAIHDYTKGMPPMMTNIMNMLMPEFIEALAPDEQAAADAKQFWKRVLESTKK